MPRDSFSIWRFPQHLAPQATTSSNGRFAASGVAAPGARPHIGWGIGAVEGRSQGAGMPRIVWDEAAEAGASPELRDLIRQLQQGLACQAATSNMATTAERVRKDRQLLMMPATLKMMHAIKADMEDRLILATDVDPRSIEFLLKNPSITLA